MVKEKINILFYLILKMNREQQFQQSIVRSSGVIFSIRSEFMMWFSLYENEKKRKWKRNEKSVIKMKGRMDVSEAKC